jgi:hypothetical protein
MYIVFRSRFSDLFLLVLSNNNNLITEGARMGRRIWIPPNPILALFADDLSVKFGENQLECKVRSHQFPLIFEILKSWEEEDTTGENINGK